MRTVTYYYLMNLAVADIAIAVFSEWTWLQHHFIKSWIFGEAFCKFSTVFQGRCYLKGIEYNVLKIVGTQSILTGFI